MALGVDGGQGHRERFPHVVFGGDAQPAVEQAERIPWRGVELRQLKALVSVQGVGHDGHLLARVLGMYEGSG